ncbi:MAG TPA: alpha/beta hydrolase [Alphaproteobacteria bacterium]|nr:alpha/beta hydrolase [Alphaproteobacteria bacterium]
MDTRHLVDPELLAGLELMPAFDFTPESLLQIRAGMAEMQKQQAAMAPPSNVRVEERRVPGPKGAPDVRVLVYTPPGASSGPRAGYLQIHGGGYVMGSPEMNDLHNKALTSEIGCVTVSVDYRLAPETPHPGPVEDCYAALKWLHGNAAALGVDPKRIAIGGESAGGGLAAALALLARDRGEVPIIFQRLKYPMIDDRTVTRNPAHPYTGEFVWTAAANRFGWHSLLGREPGGPDVSPYAAASRAVDLKGLPPTYISTGALDIFLDENLDYAKRLLAAGVPTELHVYPGAYHGYDIAVDADVTKRSAADALRALKRALG